MSAITTHVLDLSRGRPAAGVPVQLDMRDAQGWRRLAEGAGRHVHPPDSNRERID